MSNSPTLNIPLGNISLTIPTNVADVKESLQTVTAQATKQADAVVERTTELAVTGGIALALLIGGWLIANYVATYTQKALIKARLEETFAAFIGSVMRYIFFLSVALVALRVLGIGSTSLLAMFGAIGLAVAFALRGTLSHVAAGVMLIVNRPFKVGDYIELEQEKQAGTVKRITLFNTEINTLGNLRVFIPNTKIWENIVFNHSYNNVRMIEGRITIGYASSAAHVRGQIHKVFGLEDKILKNPEPFVGVDELAADGVVYLIRIWVRAKDYATVKYQYLEDIRQAVTKAGMVIPYPTRTVVLEHAAPKPPKKKA